MVAAIFLTVVVDLIGFGLILPLLPFYAIHFGASAFTVAALAAVFSVAQFLSAPLVGGLSDRWGRKPVFLACTVLTAIGYVWLALADSLLAIFLARIVAGVGSGKIGIAQAIIADATPPERRARGMGLIGAAFGIGMILGPMLGGLLVGPDPSSPNYQYPAFAAAAASCLALLLAVLTVRETLTPGIAIPVSRNPLKALPALNRMALAFILINFAINFVFAQIETLFPLFASARLGWHAYEVGIAFTFIGIIVLVTQGGLIGPLSRRFGEARLLTAGLIALATGTAAAGWIFSLPPLAVQILLTAGGFALVNPSINSLISRSADPGQQGLTMGTNQSLAALGRVLGPLWGGLLFEEIGVATPYVVGGLTLLLTLGFGWRCIRSMR
ncbi:MAG TPA: MFS transporter [Ferrovibrio sp.]|jgi:DHA1 family tetracycline resistance protein-like MFS transporter|uniref:MFS transporter n=1 Tax=Ferrovibrio sp. TaxID=1917215 RepID=UPI002B4ADAEF|nr:MFS transporter [Ferrovibrio sp.]HLT79190.1 MFS transporter [Ferrovibrio sp.]